MTTEAIDPEAGPVPGPDPAEPGAPPPRVPAPGDLVAYQGREARVIYVHPPGGPRARVDVVVYHGAVPQAITGAQYDLNQGSNERVWCWADETPPPPPTLEQILEAARAAGERVPRVGETVLYISQAADMGWVRYLTRRARVVAVVGPRSVDLQPFRNSDPPEDSREDDPLSDLIYRNLARADPGRVAEGRAGGNEWSFADEWVLPEPVNAESLRARPCTRCGARSRGLTEFIAKDRAGRALRPELCEACAEEVREFLAARPAAAAG